MNKAFLAELRQICSEGAVEVACPENEHYGHDVTTNQNYSFDCLVKPANEREVSEIIKACYKHNVPVTPRGGGSGVSGGALPVKKGLVLSTERLDKVIEIDPFNKIAITESGVITDHFCEQVAEKGLFLPVKPSSSYMSFIGGNVALNSGSINSLKYGSISNYVINLQVVLPNGEIIWTGANTSKNSTGYNLTQLLVGSEGTLGVITKIAFRLISKPQFEYSLSARFASMEQLCKSILSIYQSDLDPCAIEMVDEYSSQLTSEFLKTKSPDFCVSNKPQLLVSFDGNDSDLLERNLEKCYCLIEEHSEEVFVAKSNAEKKKLWEIRMNVGEALTQGNRVYRDIDMAIPVSKLFDYIIEVKRISKLFAVQIACFGHAGNGNLHTMLALEKIEDLGTGHASKAIEAIYRLGIKLGGTISGEHGIGMLQKEFMPHQFSNAYLKLISDIKSVFDPKNLINPGKIIN